jgi:outer membrane cobalamin receptor
MLLKKASILMIWFLWPTLSFAQSRLDSIQRLDEVTVVADRYREVIPSQRLVGEELEALSSFSVADAVRYFSGAQIKDYGGIGGLKTVDIRSMGSHHVGVFYDGIELGNAQNGQVDLGKFSLDNIEEISLYNGQKSAIFQSAKDFGSAGTMYLRTRRPRFEGGKRTNLVVRMRGGSFDLANPSVLWEQKLGPRTSSSLSTEYVTASGKYKFRYRKIFPNGETAWDTTAFRQNGDVRAFRLEGGLNGYLDKGKWLAKAYLYDSEKGIPGAIVNNVWKHYERQWDRNFFVQASFQQELFAHNELMLNAKYANDWMRYLSPDTTLMHIDNVFRQQEVYVSAANKYALLPNFDVSLSVDYQWNILDADLQDFVYPKRHTLLAALATAFEWRGWKAQASLLGTFVREEVTRVQHFPEKDLLPEAATGTPENTQELTPSLFASYQPFREKSGLASLAPLRLRAFYKHIFRMPTLNDLYYTDIGNISLLPEYTVQYDLGALYERDFSRKFTDFRLQTDVYYNEVTNKIVAVPSRSGGQYRWTMMNLGFVEIRGAEISTQITWHPAAQTAVQLRINYTYQRAQDFSYPEERGADGGSWGGQIAYIPWHSGSVVANARHRSWDLNYSFLYVGERYHSSYNLAANHEQPWYTHDMAVGKTFVLGRFRSPLRCKLTAEVNNLLDQAFDVITCYPMPGRNYKVILKIEI